LDSFRRASSRRLNKESTLSRAVEVDVQSCQRVAVEALQRDGRRIRRGLLAWPALFACAVAAVGCTWPWDFLARNRCLDSAVQPNCGTPDVFVAFDVPVGIDGSDALFVDVTDAVDNPTPLDAVGDVGADRTPTPGVTCPRGEGACAGGPCVSLDRNALDCGRCGAACPRPGVCLFGLCFTNCGGLGVQCCANLCAAGLVCSSISGCIPRPTTPCGGPDPQMCCMSDATACDVGYRCNIARTRCEPCGGDGQPCCAAGRWCAVGYVCDATDACRRCGLATEPCCSAGQCSGTLRCTAGRCS